MSESAKKYATYEDLYTIPENTIGEIINGQLIVTPRPSRKHIYATSTLDKKLGPPYQFGENRGPGGWVILIEPEIGLGEHVLVPDLAGWKRERYLEEEPHNWISVSPDWICEIISPSTEAHDRDEKMSIYAQYGVPYAWLINPIIKSLEAYKLLSESWLRFATYSGNKKVRIEPFEQVEIDLEDLWGLRQ